ncbi:MULTISPECIES: tetratricopeptide repeat protein [unclassified Streptomyces]|uniref:tetratricopeptide repeat protein n=1 Tax=unclassified Streptomyces TaxID=2593676 RepID=UPI0013BDB7AF|nr:tetratricopeptide repeat protein [Streptomyces sp. SID14446]NEB33026.1 tetratricopeptide repeat protein [Streptomyces sp. SID14446]
MLGTSGRPNRPWLRLAALAAVSAVLGLLAALYGSEAWAGVLGAVVATFIGAATVSLQTEWHRRTETARRRPRSLAIHSPGGLFPLVRDLHDPVAVGVHPAESVEQNGSVDRVPTYVSRDIEPHLHAALRRGGFVLLVGESTAGKTRAAFEAIRLLHPDYHFAAPSTREAVEVLLDDWEAVDRCVVWLDDLERFLGPGGLTISTLNRLLIRGRRVLVLATMRSHEYDRYRDRAETESAGSAQEVWRQGRAVLRQAQVVHVERRWTSTERERVRAVITDPRLTRALAGDERFGVAELLAAGPELVEAWQHAWTPGHHPRGAAVVAAAVDARRAGYHRPLPSEILQQLHEVYLSRRGGVELRPESFAEALSWALTPTVPAGANSLLLGDAERGCIAFDYLIDLTSRETIPDPVWVAITELAPPHEAYAIACNAVKTGQFAPAVPALRRAAQAGIGEAEGILWDLDVPMRSATEGLVTAQAKMEALRRELGPDHEETLIAESMVAFFTMRCGQHSEARHLYEQLTSRAASTLGINHRSVLGMEFGLATSVFAMGSEDEGLSLLEAALQKSISTLGPGDLAVLDRRRTLVELLTEAGRDDDALQRLPALERDCAHLPATHPINVGIRRVATRLRQQP